MQPQAERSADRRGDRVRRRHGPSDLAHDDRPVRVVAARRRRDVFVGDWNGRVWALRRRTGKLRWVTKLRGAGEGRRRDLRRTALRRRLLRPRLRAERATGKIALAGEGAAALRQHAGNFYATPAVAYGRVYIGATDGKIYSFGATSGKLRWSQSTGGYVYSSPAVWRDRVYVGSYSQRFFCLDAATGDDPLAVHGERPDLRLADGRRRPRLLRDAEGDDVRARRDDRRPGVDVPRRQVLAGRRRRRRGSTSSATRGSTGSSRSARRLDAAPRLDEAGALRDPAAGRPGRHRDVARRSSARDRKASGVQVCNVVLRKRTWLVAGERSGAPCSAVAEGVPRLGSPRCATSSPAPPASSARTSPRR